MIKVYTEVLGFNNLMYRYMSLPNSLSLADLAYYTLASYLSEEYADFVIESNGIPFACPNCEDEQFNKLPCASSIQPDFKEGDTFKMVYDLEEPFEIEIQVEKVDDIEEDATEGGSAGGLIVAEGTPEQVAEVPGSFTGQYLKPLLEKDAKLRAEGK